MVSVPATLNYCVMERKMFYKAGHLIFKRAQALRNNMIHTEMLLWSYLRTGPSGLKFRRQHPVASYIVDFFCYKLKLVIEVDGSIHDVEEVKLNDEEREKILRSEGLTVIRFTNKEILYELDKVIVVIDTYIHNTLTEKIKEGMTTPSLGGRGE